MIFLEKRRNIEYVWKIKFTILISLQNLNYSSKSKFYMRLYSKFLICIDLGRSLSCLKVLFQSSEPSVSLSHFSLSLWFSRIAKSRQTTCVAAAGDRGCGWGTNWGRPPETLMCIAMTLSKSTFDPTLSLSHIVLPIFTEKTFLASR